MRHVDAVSIHHAVIPQSRANCIPVAAAVTAYPTLAAAEPIDF